MEKIVAVVICGLVALTAAGAPAAATNRDLLRTASHLSGLPVRRVVPEEMLAGAQYDSAVLRAAQREYPRSLRNVDAALYGRLGLMPRSLQAQLVSASQGSRAWYDPAVRTLLLRRTPMPQRARVVNELVDGLAEEDEEREAGGMGMVGPDGRLEFPHTLGEEELVVLPRRARHRGDLREKRQAPADRFPPVAQPHTTRHF